MNKAITTYIKAGDFPSFHTKEGLNALNDKICNLQCLLIFTNEEVGKVTDITSKFIVEKQARIGSISPIEVIIPAGPTGMDSSQIEYFQALKIPTKVIKNQLEIVTATKILTVGAKITLSEINLMKKFNIKPYKHFVIITQIYMSGKLYDSGILKITNDYMKSVTDRCIRNVAAFSIASGVTNKASAPHIIVECFKNILGLSLASKIDIPQTKLMTAAAAEPVEVAAPKKAEKVKEAEPEPEEDAGGFGDLFG
jgi:large subunit ribosomal protein LP0